MTEVRIHSNHMHAFIAGNIFRGENSSWAYAVADILKKLCFNPLQDYLLWWQLFVWGSSSSSQHLGKNLWVSDEASPCVCFDTIVCATLPTSHWSKYYIMILSIFFFFFFWLICWPCHGSWITIAILKSFSGCTRCGSVNSFINAGGHFYIITILRKTTFKAFFCGK